MNEEFYNIRVPREFFNEQFLEQNKFEYRRVRGSLLSFQAWLHCHDKNKEHDKNSDSKKSQNIQRETGSYLPGSKQYINRDALSQITWTNQITAIRWAYLLILTMEMNISSRFRFQNKHPHRIELSWEFGLFFFN